MHSFKKPKAVIEKKNEVIETNKQETPIDKLNNPVQVYMRKLPRMQNRERDE